MFTLLSDWSDYPDGPFVEKGGAAQMARQNGARPLWTAGASGLEGLGTAASHATALGGATMMSYLKGDIAGVDEVMPAAGLKASVHGDVVHSRPLTINYGAGKITIFYGVNDGVYRAVDASDGSEKWGFIAPEHMDRIKRMYDNTPLVRFTGEVEDPALSYAPKDYFFDGSTGQLLEYDDNDVLQKAYIYPTMRRGGRMIYGFDVSDPDVDPTLLWRLGCPNLNDDVGCSTGFTDIGQTWSTPVGAVVGGYNDGGSPATSKPIVMFGGGFDNCLNADTATYPAACASAKGNGVYILDAETGTLLKSFTTDAPVITDVGFIDVDFNGNMDFGYAADVAGGLYRINFSTLASADPENGVTELDAANWTITKIAQTASNSDAFLQFADRSRDQGQYFRHHRHR